jgi:hypothetical protein
MAWCKRFAVLTGPEQHRRMTSAEGDEPSAVTT